jgi:imidazolonepropionase-like amidohydrolase
MDAEDLDRSPPAAGLTRMGGREPRRGALGLAGAVVLASVLPAAVQSGCASRSPARESAAGAGEVWIHDATVISPERKQPLAHAHVLLRGGRIAWVGTAPPRDLAPTARSIDGAGRYLVPGLIDGHVHLALVPGMSPPQQVAMPRLADLYFRQLPRSYLYFGFTAVVDLSVFDRDLMARIRRADLGPAVFDCGGGLPIANGYPMAFLPPGERFARFPNFLYDARQAGSIPAAYPPAEHTAAAAVDRVAAGGGICVKTFFEPGFGHLRGKLPTLTPELMGEVRAASHRHHLPLLLHANSLSAHRFAVATRPDAVAHGLWNWEVEGRAGDAADSLPAEVSQVLDDEVRAGIGMMPTSRVISGLEELFAPGFLDDPQLARVLPADLLAWYRTEAGGWFARETARDFDGAPPERIRQIFRGGGDAGRAAAAAFVRRGGRLLFGSDTPSAPTYANPPGYNGYLEMRELERAGISPARILAAATIEVARFFGLAGDYGTVEPGKRASLLLLRADPLASTSAFDTIELVIVAGRVVSRSELAAR